jgi:hypothetical protein
MVTICTTYFITRKLQFIHRLYEVELISLSLYKGSNKLCDWKQYIYSTYSPWAPHTCDFVVLTSLTHTRKNFWLWCKYENRKEERPKTYQYPCVFMYFMWVQQHSLIEICNEDTRFLYGRNCIWTFQSSEGLTNSYADRSRDSSFDIVTGYRLDGLVCIPRSGRLFSSPQRPDPVLGPTQPPIQWVPGSLSSGVKRPGREADHWPPS